MKYITQTKISVIVPVFNVESKIRRCIDSLLKQDFDDYEVILVDDGSQDGSGDICDWYARFNSKITVIHQINSGASVARNIGLKHARGTFIVFCDSDDYVDKDYILQLYNTVKNGIDIGMCSYYMVDEAGNLSPYDHGFADGTIFDKQEIVDIIYERIAKNTNTTGYFSLCNKIIRRKIITDNDLCIDNTMSFGEDMVFVMDCLKYANGIAFTDKRLYFYEQTQNGLFNKYRSGFLNDIMKCYSVLVKQVINKDGSIEEIIPLSLKYEYYIQRHIQGIIKNEISIFRNIYNVYKHPTVKEVLKRIAFLDCLDDNIELKAAHSKYELRIPKLVTSGHLILATFWTIYVFDEYCWIRKIKRKLRKQL